MDLRKSIDAQTKKLIADELAAIPEGKRGALLVIADETGAQVHVAARIGDHWKVAAAGGRRWDGAVEGKVAVIGAW